MCGERERKRDTCDLLHCTTQTLPPSYSSAFPRAEWCPGAHDSGLARHISGHSLTWSVISWTTTPVPTHWIALRENLQENIWFLPWNIGGFRFRFSLKPIQWVDCSYSQPRLITGGYHIEYPMFSIIKLLWIHDFQPLFTSFVPLNRMNKHPIFIGFYRLHTHELLIFSMIFSMRSKDFPLRKNGWPTSQCPAPWSEGDIACRGDNHPWSRWSTLWLFNIAMV